MSIDDLIAEAERELRTRANFYSKYVKSKVMTPGEARFRYDCMAGIIKILKEVKEQEIENMRPL